MANKNQTAGKTATKLVCPVCGAEFAIADHEHKAHGIVLGKDSGLGTIYMPLDKPGKQSKVNDRMQQLADKGIDTSSFFSMHINGKEELIKQSGNGISIVNEEVFDKILGSGTIRGKHLFKQHVMAQMLKYLVVHDKNNYSELVKDSAGNYDLSGYQEHMIARGYEDTWKVLVGMLERQAAMFRNGDTKCLKEDNMWYNKPLVLTMFDDYVSQLHDIFVNARRRKCRGKEYIKFQFAARLVPGITHAGVFTKDAHKIFEALERWRKTIERANTPERLYNAVRDFNNVRPELHLKKGEFAYDKEKKELKFVEVKQCKAWQNAYKGYGAYFTMQNMILFHGCYIWDGETHYTTDGSIEKLNELAQKYKHDGYAMLGALRQFILDNKFDIAAKQAEWRAKYRK